MSIGGKDREDTRNNAGAAPELILARLVQAQSTNSVGERLDDLEQRKSIYTAYEVLVAPYLYSRLKTGFNGFVEDL